MYNFLKHINGPIHDIKIDGYGSRKVTINVIFNDGKQSSLILNSLELLDDNNQEINDFFENEIYKNKTKLRMEKLERILDGTKY